MNGKGTLKVFETPDLMSEGAGKFIVQLAAESIVARNQFVISLSGGNTPGKLYALLANPIFRNQIEWKKTFIFWGDERCVPLNDERNNAFIAKQLLLNNIDIPDANINPMPVDLAPAEAAQSYEETLKQFFNKNPPRFDLILLGLGDNGHTASLFPGTSVLNEEIRWVKELYVEEQQMFRVTMTAPLINQALNVVFLVIGKGKADILKTVMGDGYQPGKYPAQLIRPADGELFWFLDRAAAGLISGY